MACQCALRRSARSPARRSTERSQTSGAMVATPSSVAFSTSASMRSLAGMPRARVTGVCSSRSSGWWASRRAVTSLRPMASTSACHWPPRPSNSVIASPGCSRSTCTWRLAPGGRQQSAPASSGDSTWMRGGMGPQCAPRPCSGPARAGRCGQAQSGEISTCASAIAARSPSRWRTWSTNFSASARTSSAVTQYSSSTTNM